MDQPQSGRPAKTSRQARRSLLEFALPASGTLIEMPSAAWPVPTVQRALATRRDEQPFNVSDEDQIVAASALRRASNLDGVTLEDDTIFQQFEDMTLTAAKAANAYRSWMLERMKINVCAALDYVNVLGSVNLWTELVAHPDAREQGKNSYSQSTDKNTPAIAEAYHANPFELMMANLNNTLEYGQRLLNIKTPIEFIELSTSHARKQLELIIKQTAELGWIVHCR